jgi:hypothetical protein
VCKAWFVSCIQATRPEIVLVQTQPDETHVQQTWRLAVFHVEDGWINVQIWNLRCGTQLVVSLCVQIYLWIIFKLTRIYCGRKKKRNSLLLWRIAWFREIPAAKLLPFREFSFLVGLNKESCLLHVRCSIHIYVYTSVCRCVYICGCDNTRRMITVSIIPTPEGRRASHKQVTARANLGVCCVCCVTEMLETRCGVLAAVAGSCECQSHV